MSIAWTHGLIYTVTRAAHLERLALECGRARGSLEHPLDHVEAAAMIDFRMLILIMSDMPGELSLPVRHAGHFN